FSSNVQGIINPNPPEKLLAVDTFKILEVNNIAEIPITALSNPDLLLEALSFDLPIKLGYILLNFSPTCFLAFLSPFTLLPSFLWFFLSLLSNWPPYYQLSFQYSAFTLPFITIATIEAIQHLVSFLDARSKKRILTKISILLLVVGLILSVFTSPLSILHEPGNFEYFRDYGISYPSNLDDTIIKMLRDLPEDATILTTPILFSHISPYSNTYLLPPRNMLSRELYVEHLKYLRDIEFDFIVFTSYFGDKNEAEALYDKFIKGTNEFSLFIEGAGVEVYKRGYEGSPARVTTRFSHKELNTGESTTVVEDVSSESGKSIMLRASPQSNRDAWFGPYITMRPNNYTANFKIKVDPLPTNETIIRLDVWAESSQNIIASYDVHSTEFRKSSTWHTFSIPFNLTKRVKSVEFRGTHTAGNVTVWLDYVEIVSEP
ncbi:MAG: DUF2079 domain-containing protein, partial [Thermoproteota archaeon]